MRVHPQQHTQAGWHTVGQAYLTDITAAVHWAIQHEPSTSQQAEMACKQARQDASLNKVLPCSSHVAGPYQLNRIPPTPFVIFSPSSHMPLISPEFVLVCVQLQVEISV